MFLGLATGLLIRRLLALTVSISIYICQKVHLDSSYQQKTAIEIAIRIEIAQTELNKIEKKISEYPFCYPDTVRTIRLRTHLSGRTVKLPYIRMTYEIIIVYKLLICNFFI